MYIRSLLTVSCLLTFAATACSSATEMLVPATMESPTPQAPTQSPTSETAIPPTASPVTVNLTLVGEWPGGTDAARAEFDLIYPVMVKYLGEPLSRWDSLTWNLDPTVTDRSQVEWDPQNDVVRSGPLPDFLGPPAFPGYPLYSNLYQQFDHETAHLFLDVGDDVIQFTFGQWIWEAHALVGQSFTYSEIYGQNMGLPLLYDSTASIGWDGINGVLNDGDKYNRTIVDSNATAALRLVTEVLSHDTGFNFIRNVNTGLLAEYQTTHDVHITVEQYKRILNTAAGGRTMDGLAPGDWLFSQPVSNINGALGPRLIVRPFYSVPSEQIGMTPTGLEVTTFERQAGARPNEPRELTLGDLSIKVIFANAAGDPVKQGTALTGGNGTANLDVFSDTSALDTRDLPNGAYTVTAETSYQGETLVATNFFVVMDTFVALQDNRLFIVPMNEDGTALRPELVDQLNVANGRIQEKLDGVLVVTAEPGAGVEFSLGKFHAVISKPVTGRLVALRVP